MYRILTAHYEKISSDSRVILVFKLCFLGYVYWIVSQVVLDTILTQWAPAICLQFDRYMDFQAPRPFAFRVLTPAIVNYIDMIVPDAISSRWTVIEWDGLTRIGRVKTHYQCSLQQDVKFYIWLWFVFGCLFLTQWIWRYLLLKFGEMKSFLGDFLPAVLLLFFPLLFSQGGYAYDFSDLALTSLLLATFLNRSWYFHYFVFVLCLLNKEANSVLVVWPLLFIFSMGKRSAIAHFFLHLLVALVVVKWGRWYFSSLEGFDQIFYFYSNLNFLLSVKPYFGFTDTYAPTLPTPSSINLVNLGLLLVVILQGARLKLWDNLVLFLGTALVILPLFLLFGYENEVRVFMPAMAPLVLMVGKVIELGYSGSKP